MKSIVIALMSTALASPAFAGGGQWQGQQQIQSSFNYNTLNAHIKNTNNNVNYNTNNNKNTNYNSAGASSKSSATGGNASATGVGGSSSNVIGINNGSNVPWWGYGSSTAIAPGNAVGNGVCASTASFAAGFIGSVSFGFPMTDHSCNLRANYTTFKLPKAVQRKLMCEDRYLNAAFVAAGLSDCNGVAVAR